jgi:hypothetical protein
MSKIAELRQSKTNVQNLQEYVLMKHKYVTWMLVLVVVVVLCCVSRPLAPPR